MTALTNQIQQLSPVLAIEYWDGPSAIATISPPSIKNKMLSNVSSLRHVIQMDESKLYDQVKPSTVLNMLRYRFWELIQKYSSRGEQIPEDQIYRGITDRDTYERHISTLGGLGWMLRPPMDNKALLRDAHEVITSRLRKFLEGPLTLKETLAIFKVLDTKLNGAPIQRVESKNFNINAELQNRPQTPAEMMTEEEMEKEIMRIRQAAARATFTPKVVVENE